MTEDERKETNRKLIEKYPMLYPYCYVADDRDPYDFEWTELDRVPNGWKTIFLEACDKIMRRLREVNIDPNEFHFFEIKEKYGCLEARASGYTDEVIEGILFDDLHVRSLLYCPACGNPTKFVTVGQVQYFLCPDCAKKAKLESEPLTEKDIPMITEYDYETKQKTRKETAYDAQFRSQWVPIADGPET